MLTNYFKIALRSLMKNPLNSFINVFGLAIAIGICVFAYGLARYTFDTDQFHEHKNEVFLITFFGNRGGTVQEYGRTPRPLGEMLANDFTHVKKVCRVEDRNVVIKFEDNVYHERIRFTDAEFLEMFTFPLKWGTPASLHDQNSIVISEEMSVKYFGEANPIGRELLVKFDENRTKFFHVTGVAKKFPEARTIEFEFLINFENFTTEPGYKFQDWNEFVNATLIQIDPADIGSITNGMDKYLKLHNAAVDEDWAISSFAFVQLAKLHKRSSAIKDDISYSTDSGYQSIVFLAIVSLFMLALACFNYINIAIVSAARRLKEIGVRKAIGATRSVLIMQFLIENIIITSFALIVGVILGTFLFIPWIENLNHFGMDFTLLDPNLWIFLPAVLLITGIASGLYPSLYISHFQVVRILKGTVKFGTKNPLTKVFLAVQLVLACILVTAGVTFTQNTNYMSRRSWGYDQHEALYAAVPDQAAFDKLNALLLQNPNITSISGSTHHLGKTNARTVVHLPDHEYEVDEYAVDPNYLSTMGLHLESGRMFRDHYEEDIKTIVVNESFAKFIGNSNPIGKIFRIDSVQYEVIGVAQDFHSYSFFRKINPVIFRVAAKESYRYLSVRTRPGTQLTTSKALQSAWNHLYPDVPYDGGFQEDVWGAYYEQLNVPAKVWKALATIAILLAMLGVYGVVTLNVAGRAKEFSIRKILGASVPSIVSNIGKQYLLLTVTGLGIGAPASYFLMNFLFDSIYSYHMPITYSVAIVGVLILIVVLTGTISTQLWKVLKSNPVDGLKVE